MGSMEFRELGPGNLRALMGHVFGAAPVESPPRGEADYAANEDGPWERSPDEFDEQMYRLVDERSAVRAAKAEAPSDAVDAREWFAEGVWAAANWTLARTREAPMTMVPLVVNDAGLREEIEAARVIVDAGEGPSGVAYARGVLAWFAWLAGARGTIDYRG